MTPKAEEASRQIGKYQVVGTLGRGSMGVVYKAKDPEIGRIVALKTLRKLGAGQFHSADQALARFRQEARSAGNLRHQNVITIFEIGRDGDTPFIVMDYVEGESLDVIIKANVRLNPRLALRYLRQVAMGLDYAHEKGVIHRDIKPSNILVDPKEAVYILDFGVATITGKFAEAEDPTTASLVMGTPGYMSPEQILNEKLDHRSDLFSFGIVAYECFAGQRPFPGDTFTTVVGNILEAKPISLTSVVPELPLALEAEFEKALAKKKDDRFSSAVEMIEAFSKAVGTSSAAVDTDSGKSNARPRKPSEWQSIKIDDAKGASPEEKSLQEITPESKSPRTSGSNSSPHSDNPWAHKYKRAGDVFKSTNSTYVGGPPVTKVKSKIPIIVGALCLIGAAYLFYLYAQDPEVVPVPRPDPASASTAQNAQDPIEVPSIPRTETAPAGKSVLEMSSAQLLGVIVNPKSEDNMLIQALREARRRSAAGLVEAASVPLHHDSYLVRIESLKILAEIGDRSVVPQIVLVLDDHDPSVRLQAAKALGALGDRASLGYLSARLMKEDSPESQTAIKQAIDKIRGYSSSSK